LRFGRPKVPNFTTAELGFEIGKGILLQPGTDVTVVATGHLVWEALEAAKELNDQGISVEVINIHTIKPLDEEIILKSVSKTSCIVTAEEHNYLGGMGESIAGLLSRTHPTPQEYVATQDCFGESGTPAQLMEKYGLNKDSIIKKVKLVLERK
jgi:transketolase